MSLYINYRITVNKGLGNLVFGGFYGNQTVNSNHSSVLCSI